MSNFTIEDYKTAIRANYKVAIEEDVSGILSDPTPAQLRDFYLRLLERGLSKIDEEIMKMFLRANENSSLKKTIENCNIEKFKPIISFLKGSNTDNKARIEMAAILVNFQLRPFRKFQDDEDIIEEEQGNMPENDNVCDKKEEKKDFDFFNSGETNSGKEAPINGKNNKTVTDTEQKNNIHFLGLISKPTILGISLIICLLSLVVYLTLFKKECMQWNNDHYDIVDCSLKVEGLGTYNKIEPLVESRVNLRKIKVCDTTTFFKNDEAVVFYSKSNNMVEYFNQLSPHPEKPGQFLKPITNHIIQRYVKPCK